MSTVPTMFAVAVLARVAVGDVFSVRVGYVIPVDRGAQSDGIFHVQQYLPTVRNWYRDQMERYGFGGKTFRYETDADGATPTVHVVATAMNSSELRADVWGNTISAASAAGLSTWTPGQVWLLVPESHLQLSDGSVSGGAALGASFGSGSDPGVAVGGSDFLFRLAPDELNNGSQFSGQIVPQIGPFPLTPTISFPWFEGTTFSSISSSAQGALAHELGHAFGLGHDYRNDSNFHGNLMGNGLRGWRASMYPSQYPDDDIQLSYASALALSASRYFNSDKDYSDNTKPTLLVTDSGILAITDGKLHVHFTASDSSGLSAALLRRNGDVIGELPLTGVSVSAAFQTPYFTRGRDDAFSISVYDTQGNRQDSTVRITPYGEGNVAPQPYLAVYPSTVLPGQAVYLDASSTHDPDNSMNSLLFEWDLDGDGVFTAPSPLPDLSTTFLNQGARLVSVRVTDPSGAWATSAPLAIKVLASGDVNFDGTVDIFDVNLVSAYWGESGPIGDANYDGVLNIFDVNVISSNWSPAVSDTGDTAAASEPSGIALGVLSLMGVFVLRSMWTTLHRAT